MIAVVVMSVGALLTTGCFAGSTESSESASNDDYDYQAQAAATTGAGDAAQRAEEFIDFLGPNGRDRAAEGIKVTDMGEEVRESAVEIFRALLSTKGFNIADDILTGNHCNDEDKVLFVDTRDEHAMRLAVEGTGLRIGAQVDAGTGTVSHEQVELGMKPAIYAKNGTVVQPLAGMQDSAQSFADSLNKKQRSRLVQGDRHEAKSEIRAADFDPRSTPTQWEATEASAASAGSPDTEADDDELNPLYGDELNDAQQTLLLELIRNWVGIFEDRYAQNRLADIANNIDDLAVSWWGSTDTDDPDGFALKIEGVDFTVELDSVPGAAMPSATNDDAAGSGKVTTSYSPVG